MTGYVHFILKFTQKPERKVFDKSNSRIFQPFRVPPQYDPIRRLHECSTYLEIKL